MGGIFPPMIYLLQKKLYNYYMELVCHRKIEYKTFVHDFENGFLYVQNWENNRLKDDFFVHSGDLYPDGSIRPNKTKYFYSRFKGEEVKKEIGIVKIGKFKWFDNLYYIDDYGEVRSINEEIQKIEK